jgi:tRNA (guanine-N7-)-methyltransferase
MRIRVRDHVNPFSPRFAVPPAPLDFGEVFQNPDLPLHLDLGCALGGFVFKMARFAPGINFLGVDIREPMIERAKRLAADANLTNLHYEFCNATISIENLLRKMPPRALKFVTIQFPDPHLKKRLAKRRMVQPHMIEDLAEYCDEKARIFIQSDVKETAADICEKFEQNPNFRRAHAEIWLAENPFPVKTEREAVVETQDLPVFRAMFEKKAVK